MAKKKVPTKTKTPARKRVARKRHVRQAAVRSAEVGSAAVDGTIAIPLSIVDTMDEAELDRALATGQHREALEEHFGPELYRELSMLAGAAQRRSSRGGGAGRNPARDHGL